MKIGDLVKSDHLHLTGVVEDIRLCRMDEKCACEEDSLTLDKEGSGVIFYYHARTFKVIEEGR